MRNRTMILLLLMTMTGFLKAQMSIDFQYTLPLCWNSNSGSLLAIVTGGSGNYSYLWSTGDVTSLADSLPGGIYTVVVTDNTLGITATDSFHLHNPDPLVVHSAMTHNLCYGGHEGAIALQVQGGVGGFQFNWISHPTLLGPVITNLHADMYTVVVSDTNGCSVTQSFEITQMHHEAIRPIIDVSPVSCRDGIDDGIISIPDVHNIHGAPTFIFGGSSFLNAHFDSLASDIYTVLIQDENMCIDTFYIGVPFLDIPCVIIYNGFSPNSDGINDTWEIDNIFLFPEASVRLWNIDGKLIYESEPGYPEPWDGTFNDKLLPPSTLYYEVNLNSEIYKPYTGYVRIEY